MSKSNTRDDNSGSCNSGYSNSGYSNSGDYNSGYYNSGNRNSGNRNSGYSNSGNYNSGNYNSGYFNTDEPTVRLFNKDTNLKRSEVCIPYVHLPLTEYKDGKLITRTYKEAWKIAWKDLSEYDKNSFLNLPNFCSKIFEEITGINVNSTKKIIIDGKEIEISIESFEELKRSLIK